MSSTKISVPSERVAWCIVQRGSPAKALRKKVLPMPTLKDNEVLVRVEAAALNPVGYKLMGMLPQFLAGKRRIAEHDFAGVVVDSRSPEFVLGEPVYGWNPFPTTVKDGEGALATYIKTHADRLAKTPPGFSAVDVAGVTLTCLTAYQALFYYMDMQPGQSVFIHGGGTSVGRYAIQLAKAKGLRVTASASPRSSKEVLALGAEEVLDYTARPLSEQLSDKAFSSGTKFDGFFDAFGDWDYNLYSRSPAYTKPSAIYLTTFPAPVNLDSFLSTLILVSRGLLPGWFGGTPRKFKWMFVKNYPNDLKEIQRLLSEGAIRPQVDSVVPFDEALEAYRRIMSRKVKGKVIVKM